MTHATAEPRDVRHPIDGIAERSRRGFGPNVNEPPILELRGITKRFGSFTANDRIDFDLCRGEVHALLGENGAGKSTLMNVLFGLYRADEGEVLLQGQPVAIGSATDALAHGLGMVHQHFMLIPKMTVAENIVLGREPRHGLLLDIETAEQRVVDLVRRFGLSVDPHQLVADVSVGQQQRVEILKALYGDADILILDEPTAVLTPQETIELFDVVRNLTGVGKSVIFITHKLHEVLEIADRITILRRGQRVAVVDRRDATEAELARLMVGRDVLLDLEKTPAHAGSVLLSVSDLHVRDNQDLEAVRGVSFTVAAGEIVGIAGVDGNGQKELVEALTGLRATSAGEIRFAGESLTGCGPKAFMDAGIRHIPEDRQQQGLILDFDLAENLGLRAYRRRPASRFGWLRPRVLVERAEELLREFDVRGGSPTTRASALSGGNQQKVVVAREVSDDPLLLVASQPTRGLDVGATEFVHQRLLRERDNGRAVLLVSFALDEIVSLSDRILVLFEGRIAGEYASSSPTDELGLAMTGGRSTKSRGDVAERRRTFA